MSYWKKLSKGVRKTIKKASRGTMNLMTRPGSWAKNVGRDIRKGYQKYDRWMENDNPITGRRRSLTRLVERTGEGMERIGEQVSHPRRTINRIMTPDIPEMPPASEYTGPQAPSQESAAAKAARRRRRKTRSLLQTSRQGNTMLGL